MGTSVPTHQKSNIIWRQTSLESFNFSAFSPNELSSLSLSRSQNVPKLYFNMTSNVTSSAVVVVCFPKGQSPGSLQWYDTSYVTYQLKGRGRRRRGRRTKRRMFTETGIYFKGLLNFVLNIHPPQAVLQCSGSFSPAGCIQTQHTTCGSTRDNFGIL